MLVMTARIGQPDEQVIIRDADGNVLCEVHLIEADRGRARWGFVAPHNVKVNRREVDATIDWRVGKRLCAICRGPLTSGERKDVSGVAHAWCAEREKS